MGIERVLRSYLDGNGPRVKDKDFFQSVDSDNSNTTISVLFKLVNEDIDQMDDTKTLDRDVVVLQYLETLLKNMEGLNRKIIGRKLLRLYEKLDRVVAEGAKKFHNIRKIESEFNKLRREIDVLMAMNEEKDTKQYDLISFLILEMKDISYLEYAFSKIPTLTNVKDKNEVPLFRNLIRSYLTSLSESNDEDVYYYQNLIRLLHSQQSFQLSDAEKKKCLEEIYQFMNKLSYNKKAEKKNHSKLEAISLIVDQIKNEKNNERSIDDLASKYNIHVSFDEDQIEAAKLVKEAKTGEMTDREVVEDYTISIDGDDVCEIDDCLSCKKLLNGHYLLGVHIASVLGYFDYDSLIVQEAISRGRSIYLPHSFQTKDGTSSRIVPIFPLVFSADKGSLSEGQKRLARSYYFEIDENGEVVSEKFSKTIVQNDKQLSYKEANKILEKGGMGNPLEETLQNLHMVSKLLDQKHKGSEFYDMLKENTDNTSELRVKKVGSENIVYQSMLLTGSRVASYFSDHHYPFLYRVHEVNEDNNKKLQDMIETLNKTYSGEPFKNLYHLIESIYPKGWYAMEGRHSGLDMDHYCHCTSVLRRSADIVVEHALEVCYDQEPTEDELEELRMDISKRAQEINAKNSPVEYFVKEYQKKYRR